MDVIWQKFITQLDDLVASRTGILFPVSTTHKTIHYSLVIVSGALALITFIVQAKKPAPYGKLNSPEEEKKWGPKIPIIPAHMTSDGPSGTLLFLFLYLKGSQHEKITNWLFAGFFMAHYLQRGFIHPFLMQYGKKSVPIGIWLGALGPNLLYHSLIADWLANAVFPCGFLYRPVVLCGIVFFVAGFVINRVADWKQREWKKKQKTDSAYTYPTGWLFNYVANPNYFGELMQWVGFLMITQAPASLTWLLFTAATFLTRSAYNLAYYRKKFTDNYPRHRKALIPFLY